MDLKEERNRDLIDSYSRVIKSLGTTASLMTRESLIERTINSSAKRFYVSVEEAAKQISRMERKGEVGVKSDLMRQQYMDIYANYLKLSVSLNGVGKYDLIRLALEQPAPQFYLKLSSACVLFWEFSKNKFR